MTMTTTGPVDALSAAIEAIRSADYYLTGSVVYGLAETGEAYDEALPLVTADLFADLDREVNGFDGDEVADGATLLGRVCLFDDGDHEPTAPGADLCSACERLMAERRADDRDEV